jgi:hypothetical protein
MLWKSVHGWRLILFIGCLGIGSAALSAEPPGAFSDEVGTDLYDCTLTVTPAAKRATASAVRLVLDWEDGSTYTALTLTTAQLAIASVKHGKHTLYGKLALASQPQAAVTFTVLRRGDWLGVVVDGKLLFRGQVPRVLGSQAGVIAEKGWSVDDAQIQRLEPVVFADNFMRTAEESGGWTLVRGQWGLKSAWDADPKGNSNRFSNIIYSQNPFAWVGRAAQGSALCMAGKAFWEDYTFSTAVYPSAHGASGMLVNLQSPTEGLLIRWSSALERTTGDKLEAILLKEGTATVLATDRGGFIPRQWYRMTVVSGLQGVQVLIDGRTRLTLPDVTPWRGGVGLYAEGADGVIFDDVAVYGRTLKKDLIFETQLAQVNDRFEVDKNGMQEWSAPRSDWAAAPAAPSYFAYRRDVYGDHWVSLAAKPVSGTGGQFCLTLNGDGTSPISGYRALVQVPADGQQTTYALYRESTLLATKTGEPLTPNVDYTFRFWHHGDRLWLEQDGEPVIAASQGRALAGQRPAYRAEGCFALSREALVLGRNILDYTFSDAPVDWLEEGTWMQTVRWACAPHWSFFAGWSRGDAALWHKQAFQGDHTFEAFIGLKMEYPRERDIYDNRYRDFGITICGDGHEVRTGYTGIYGAPAEDGIPNSRTVLMRNGTIVATTELKVPGRGAAHREWFDLALRKTGDTVEFWVEGKLALTYTDPQPLTGGAPAVWTNDNGISLARARIHFAATPTLRTEPRIVLDDPWYPEWANIGQPLSLAFEDSWSTAGKPVTLRVAPRKVPAETTSTAIVQGRKVLFTPQTPGEHWYQITATDGERTSPSLHLTLPVFDPRVGRDDTRALILYRFTEGKGQLIRDQSKLGAPCDISVPKDASVQWLPGQGLTLRGGIWMLTAGAAKLMTLAKNQALTLECWVSTDTIYPPTGWAGSILAWELSPTQRNFALGHHTGTLITAPAGGQIISSDAGAAKGPGFRTSLQHLTVTWDGTITRSYINGALVGEHTVKWNSEKWDPNAPLLLGNQGDGQRSYLGTFYLMAIHDKALAPEAVLRHYQAGPSAK